MLIEAGPHGHVKITDFGLARAADDASLTQSGVIAGTPLFMAPEQARGEALDHRADLFSLGSVLDTMCSGRAPFRAAGTLAVLKRVAEDTPRPIPEIVPEVPPWLCDLIARLHAKDPGDRVGTAREVADLLERGPAAAVPASRRPRPRPRRWAVAAALLLAAGGLSSTEASGVTDVRGTVTRLFSPEGTLVVEVDDPGVGVRVDGADLVITGAGAKAIRLKPGDYTVEAHEGGRVVSLELVAVTRDGRQVVHVNQEATPPGGKTPPAAAPFVHPYVERVAALPAADQAEAVRQEFVRRNADFGGVYATVTQKVEGGVVTEFAIRGVGADRVSDISAVLSLEEVSLTPGNFTARGLGVLRAMKSLKTVGVRSHEKKSWPAAEFWTRYDAGEFQ